jgi:hypothetical protein
MLFWSFISHKPIYMDGNFGIRLENNVSMVKDTDTKCNFGEKQTRTTYYLTT